MNYELDGAMLMYEINKKGITLAEFCEKCDMSRSAFYRKRKGDVDFTLSEMHKIAFVLGLDSPSNIFFAKKVS